LLALIQKRQFVNGFVDMCSTDYGKGLCFSKRPCLTADTIKVMRWLLQNCALMV